MREALKAREAELEAARQKEGEQRDTAKVARAEAAAAQKKEAAAEAERASMEESTKRIDKALFHAGEDVEAAENKVLDLEQELREAQAAADKAEQDAQKAAADLQSMTSQLKEAKDASKDDRSQAEAAAAAAEAVEQRLAELESSIAGSRTQHQVRSERDEGAESDDGEDIAAMLEQESIIASEALDRAESAEAQVFNLRRQLEAAQQGAEAAVSAAEESAGTCRATFDVPVLEELAAAQAAAASSMAAQSDLRRQVKALQQQLGERPEGQESRPLKAGSSNNGGGNSFFGTSNTVLLRNAEQRIEELTAENSALQEAAQQRAKTISQSKQFIAQFLDRSAASQPVSAVSGGKQQSQNNSSKGSNASSNGSGPRS